MSTSVFVIVPVYNRQSMIGRCIESIRGQDFSDWKLLVVDDGSTDDTALVVQAYVAIDSRVSTVKNTSQPSGAAGARNHGLGLIDEEAEFVAFLDSDDEWYPTHLSNCIEALTTETRADVAVEDLVRVRESGDIVSHSKFNDESGLPEAGLALRLPGGWLLKRENGDSLSRLITARFTVGLHSSVFRRSILDEQLLENYRVAEDFEFTIRLLKNGAGMLLLDSIGLRYYVHDENLSSVGQRRGIDQKHYFNCVAEVRLLKQMIRGKIYDEPSEIDALRQRISNLLFWGVAYNHYAAMGNVRKALIVAALSKRYGGFSPAMLKTYCVFSVRCFWKGLGWRS